MGWWGCEQVLFLHSAVLCGGTAGDLCNRSCLNFRWLCCVGGRIRRMPCKLRPHCLKFDERLYRVFVWGYAVKVISGFRLAGEGASSALRVIG